MREKKKPTGYKPADTYFIINDGDSDLVSIRLSLPKPPALELIDGYGLTPDEQYFRPFDIPRKLISLQKEAFETARKNYERNNNKVVTWDRVLDQYWELFEKKRDDLVEEEAFIKKVYWHREYGYWFFNDGKPTYITGDYFDFLNFWIMPDVKERGGRPEYRDKDRRKYLYWNYLEHTEETFVNINEDGDAVKEDDGTYKMMDVGARVFYGGIEPKVRRSGATQQGCHMIKKGQESTFGAYGTIISMDGENAEKHYYKKLYPAVERYPYFLMAKFDATVGSPPKKLRYRSRSSSYDFMSLDSMVDYTDSADEKKNDGDKLFYSLMDEEGKSRVNVLERWNVNKLAQSTGSGSNIIGFCHHPSTVEEMDEGGMAYYKMATLSDFYQRIPGKGQTASGLGLAFFPAYDGLENFIDRFGMSVVDTPTKRQRELRPDALFARMNMGAMEYIMKERDNLLKKNTPEALESYRSLRRKMPIQYAECWLGSSGDMGFNLEKIDQRLIELRRRDESIRGDFVWDNGIVDSKVVFVPSDTGKFEVSKLPPEPLQNLKTKEPVYVGKKRITEYHHAPLYPDKFTCGVDPIRFENKSDAKLRDNNSRQSDGGIAVFWEKDEQLEIGKDPKDWQSYKFVVSYRYRPSSTFEFNEDVLMVAVFYGATVYLENNVENTWEHFLDRGYGGYLQYDIDPVTGRFKEKPGVYSLTTSKNELFSWLKNYIDKRCHVEPFASFLKEVKDIQGPEQMTKFDRFTAHGIAGLGSRSKKGNVFYTTSKKPSMGSDISLSSAVKMLSGRGR